MALRVPARRDLGHVDDPLHTGLPGGLREIRARGDQSRQQRVDEVGSAHALHRRKNIVDLEEVASNRLDAQRAEPGRAFVILADQGADGDGHPGKRLDGRAAGRSGAPCYEHGLVGHDHFLSAPEGTMRELSPVSARKGSGQQLAGHVLGQVGLKPVARCERSEGRVGEVRGAVLADCGRDVGVELAPDHLDRHMK